jgi:hypothetical protein
MSNLGKTSSRGAERLVDERDPAGGGHPENREGADKATKDNDLTTGHSQEGDGGDANSKQKTHE